MKTRLLPRTKRAGFSLIELLVVVAIMTIITSVVLVSQGRFGSSIILSNLAYDMALSIREAQSYGLSVRESSPGSKRFDVGYGIHFSTDRRDSYILFADIKNDDGDSQQYNTSISPCSSNSECVKEYKIGRGNTIIKFCGVKDAGGTEEMCSDDTKKYFLDIVFPRAESDATFTTNLGTGFRAVRVYIKSPDGLHTRIIETTITGQIFVKQA